MQNFLNGVQAPLVVIVGVLAVIGILSLVKHHKDRKNKRK